MAREGGVDLVNASPATPHRVNHTFVGRKVLYIACLVAYVVNNILEKLEGRCVTESTSTGCRRQKAPSTRHGGNTGRVNIKAEKYR